MSYTRELSDMIRQKGQLDLAEEYEKGKKTNVDNLEQGVTNLGTHHEKFKQFVNNETQKLNSTREDLINRINNMTKEQREDYENDLANRTASSKVCIVLLLYYVLT